MARARWFVVGFGCAVVVLVAGSAGADDIQCQRGVICDGTDEADTIDGTAEGDVIPGEGGDDSILGHGGGDIINGLAGDDRVDGGAGNDAVTAGDGADVVIDDSTGDADSVYAGTGKDWIYVHDGDGRDKVTCGTQPDRVVADPTDNVAPSCEKIVRSSSRGTARARRRSGSVPRPPGVIDMRRGPR